MTRSYWSFTSQLWETARQKYLMPFAPYCHPANFHRLVGNLATNTDTLAWFFGQIFIEHSCYVPGTWKQLEYESEYEKMQTRALISWSSHVIKEWVWVGEDQIAKLLRLVKCTPYLSLVDTSQPLHICGSCGELRQRATFQGTELPATTHVILSFFFSFSISQEAKQMSTPNIILCPYLTNKL